MRDCSGNVDTMKRGLTQSNRLMMTCLRGYGCSQADRQRDQGQQWQATKREFIIIRTMKLTYNEERITYIPIPDILLSNSLDLGGGDSVHCVLNLLGGHATTARNELTSNILCNSS